MQLCTIHQSTVKWETVRSNNMQHANVFHILRDVTNQLS